jgi:PIN domain nuclease of toxin-antitoxin system
MLLVQKGKIRLLEAPEEYLRRAFRISPATLIPLTHDIAIRSRLLEHYPGRDPADRFIVATALEEDLVLLTADREMQAWDGVQTIW